MKISNGMEMRIVPKGHMVIAQRFNVGRKEKNGGSPEGTDEIARGIPAIPSGLTARAFALFPKVKTLGYYLQSLRDKGRIFVPTSLLHA